MEITLKKLIQNNHRGLFLLDPPTGFGKTTAIVDLIKCFLKGDPCFSDVKRIFFVTNLLTNLPYNDLLDLLTEEEKKHCFRAKATIDYVLERFCDEKINNLEIINSKEYQSLYKDISSYHFIKNMLDCEIDSDKKLGHRNTLRILKQKISTDSEPAFRRFLKTKFAATKESLAQGKQVLILTTYQTVGSGKNLQYPIPEGQEDTMAYDPADTRKLKDFEAIYICMPTNLLQNLSFGEDKYTDLAKYLFQQEYLYKNGYLLYAQMKTNIENGFRQVFFGDKGGKYSCNGDLQLHTLKIVIQAIGRICRCRSKNKNIYIYADKDLVRSVQAAFKEHRPALLNEEFKSLLKLNLDSEAFVSKVEKYSRQSKSAYTKIRNAAYTVRRNRQNVEEWKSLREFVLRNPTAKYVTPKYQDLYFEMSDTISGYSYRQNNRYDIVELYMEPRYGFAQVSEQACDLPILLSVPCVAKLFDEQKYAKSFSKNRFIMSPSLFRQVYLGALGEVIGKCILESQLGWDVEELDDASFYEYFDYKIGNVYFDFKHWNDFRVDNDKYVQKVERKLVKIKGAKCFVINLLKRNNAPVKQNIGGTVVQVPYLINDETGTINDDFIEEIQKSILK